MNFLNQSNLNSRPLYKYIIIGLVAVNAFILAYLLFGPRVGSSANVPTPSSSTVGMTVESASDEYLNTEDSSTADTFAETSAESTEEYDDLNGTNVESAEEGASQESGPVLELVDEHVTLKVGDYFNFYDYIKTMEDSDGSELSRYIHLRGEINTSTPGEYTITYQITSPVTGQTASKDLAVTVEE